MSDDMLNEDPAPDFDPEIWITPDIRTTASDLVEKLYEAGAGVNGIIISVPGLPGDDVAIQTDYGTLTFEGRA